MRPDPRGDQRAADKNDDNRIADGVRHSRRFHTLGQGQGQGQGVRGGHERSTSGLGLPTELPVARVPRRRAAWCEDSRGTVSK